MIHYIKTTDDVNLSKKTKQKWNNFFSFKLLQTFRDSLREKKRKLKSDTFRGYRSRQTVYKSMKIRDAGNVYFYLYL